MTTKTRTTTTIHGEVEYETVECSSCRNEVRKEDAFGFVIYDTDRLKRERDYSNHYRLELYDGGYTTGYACEHCRDNGPIEYPHARSIRKAIPSGLSIHWGALGFAILPLVGIYCSLDMITDPLNEGEVGAGIIGLVAHLLTTAAIIIVVL